jgi:hypothetical protein
MAPGLCAIPRTGMSNRAEKTTNSLRIICVSPYLISGVRATTSVQLSTLTDTRAETKETGSQKST